MIYIVRESYVHRDTISGVFSSELAAVQFARKRYEFETDATVHLEVWMLDGGYDIAGSRVLEVGESVVAP